MRRLLLCFLILASSSSLVQAKEIFRCTKGGDVRFEQTRLAGYACAAHASIPTPATGSFNSPAPMASEPLQGPGLPRKGTIYKRTINGVVEFSSKPVPGGRVAARYVQPCYACRVGKQVDFSSLRLNTNDYAPAIAHLAKAHGVDAAWVRAIVHAESNFNPNALSPKGAQGLMQLMPATARRFGVSSPFDPQQNLSGGVQYLAWLLKRFRGDHTLATAAYNAGEGAVAKHRGVPPYSETRTYVQRVSTLRTRYSTL